MPIDSTMFAKQCIREASYCSVSAHYLLGVAKLRSNIADDTQGGLVGPFRFAQADWNKYCVDAQFGYNFDPTDISDWRTQCAVFALWTRRVQDALNKPGQNASAVQLYLAQWPTTDPKTISATFKAALDATATLLQQAATALQKDGDASSAVIPDPGVDPQSPAKPPVVGAPGSSLLRGDGSFKFTAEVVGDDIQVHGVTATWFGGPNDPSDSGQTASGISTRDNPGLLGCALPMNGFNNPKTDGSPIPRLPWKTPVVVTNLATNVQRTFPLIDLGPSKFAASNAAIDLTQAAFVALGGDSNAGVLRVNYTILGAASQVPASSTSVSLQQSETSGTSIQLSPNDDGHGMSHDVPKPAVQFIASPNYSSRNGTKINMIVMHYTDGPSAQSAINRFLNPAEQVSAHYIIDRDGTIYQTVDDANKAWHAKAANARSIGIEHVALPGQQMAPPQEQSSVALLRWLMATYGIKRTGITGHQFAPGNEGTTDCPGGLFGAETRQAVVDWINVHFPVEVA